DREPFGLIETLGWADGKFQRLERHLARLAESAAYFRVPIDLAAIRRRLNDAVRGLDQPMRVRLVAREAGVTASTERFDNAARTWRCRISSRAIDANDIYRAHKTTRRGLYDEERKAATADGFDEVLFLNQRGEIAEGAITNVFLERGGVLLTPPV